MIEIRTAALLTRQLNLRRLTNLAVAVFGEGLFERRKGRGALTNSGERDEKLGQEMERFWTGPKWLIGETDQL